MRFFLILVAMLIATACTQETRPPRAIAPEPCSDANLSKRPLRHQDLRAIVSCLDRHKNGDFSELNALVASSSDDELNAVADVVELLIDDPKATIGAIDVLHDAFATTDTFEKIVEALGDKDHPLTK